MRFYLLPLPRPRVGWFGMALILCFYACVYAIWIPVMAGIWLLAMLCIGTVKLIGLLATAAGNAHREREAEKLRASLLESVSAPAAPAADPETTPAPAS